MAGLEYRKDWDVLASYFAFKELATAPATPESNVLRLYVKDSAGVSALCYKNDAGTEICLPTSGSFVTGTGVANRLAYWTGTSTIDDVPRTFTAGSILFAGVDFLPQEDNSNLFYNDTTNRVGIGTPTPATTLQVSSLPGYTDGDNKPQVEVTDTTAFAAGVGGGIAFSGKYNSAGDVAGWAGIRSLKENATDGNFAATLDLITRPAGGANTVRFRIGSAGQFGIGGATYGTLGQVFTSGGAGAPPTWSASGANHNLLDGSVHGDTVAQTVSRGSLVYGNATPKWDELVVSASGGTFLRNDATDVMWSTLILPNAATANRVVYATGANTYGEDADLTFDGTDLALGSGSKFKMQGQNRIRYHNSAVRALRTTTQSINDSTLTVVAFNATDDFDTDTLHDTVTNNSRLTAALTGKYFVYCFVDWAENTTGERITRIEKNSAGTPTSANVIAATYAVADALLVNQNVACITSLAATDHVEVIVYQTSGGALNADGATQPLAFGMAYLGE